MNFKKTIVRFLDTKIASAASWGGCAGVATYAGQAVTGTEDPLVTAGVAVFVAVLRLVFLIRKR